MEGTARAECEAWHSHNYAAVCFVYATPKTQDLGSDRSGKVRFR